MSKRNILDALLAYRSDLPFNREVSAFGTELQRLLSLKTDDSPASVEFDFFPIWESIKKASPRPSYAYMIHTHPLGLNRMSPIDKNMVGGWVKALGIPIYYFIVAGPEFNCYHCYKEDGRVVKQPFIDIYSQPDSKEWAYLSIIMDVMYGLSTLEECPDEKELASILNVINEREINILTVDCYAE